MDKPIITASMKVKVNIPGLGEVDIEDDNPEIITKLIESLTKSSITKYTVDGEFGNNTLTAKPMIPEINNVKLDLVVDDYGTVDIETAEKWTEDIARYILSKPNYEHDLGELMNNVLGRRPKQSEERKVYDTFLNKIRLVRKRIGRRYNIEWDSSERRHSQEGSYPIIYKIKKP
jgi:hypothetical protein